MRPRQKQLLAETLPRLAVHVDRFPRPGRPLWLEVGFGGGEHALAQVAAHPEIDLIACEVFDNGICSLLSRLAPDPSDPATVPLPANLFVWADDARPLLRALPEGSLEKLFLMFPDPWPKARHAKRRFVHPESIPMLARALRPGGEWRIATDDPTYQAWVTQVIGGQIAFDVVDPALERPVGWPPTRYEAKAVDARRPSFYWTTTRRGAVTTTNEDG